MPAAVHANVGLMHATMALFNAWCDRVPMVLLGATGPVDAAKRRPWIDWIHTTARPRRADPQLYQMGRSAGLAAAAREAILRARQDRRRRRRAGPTYVMLDAGLQEIEARRAVPPTSDAQRYHAAGAGGARADASPSARPICCAAASARSSSWAACRAIECLERAHRARRDAGAPCRHRSQARRRVPDRPSAACRRARAHSPAPDAAERDPRRPTSSSASTGSISPARSRRLQAASRRPKSSTSRSTSICITAGAWTTRACRRSICIMAGEPDAAVPALLRGARRAQEADVPPDAKPRRRSRAREQARRAIDLGRRWRCAAAAVGGRDRQPHRTSAVLGRRTSGR